MRKHFKSIRWHIQAWYGLLLLLATVAFSFTAYQIVWLGKIREADRRLTEKSLLIVSSLRNAAMAGLNPESINTMFGSERPTGTSMIILQLLKSGRVTMPEITQATFSGREPGYYYYRIYDTDGSVVLESDNAHAAFELLPIPGEGVQKKSQTVGNRRERTFSDESGLRMVVGQDITQEISEMSRLTIQIALLGTGLWVLGLIGGWVIAGYSIRPIKTISEAAVRISEGNLKERIPLEASGNELHELASVLNRTFGRLNEAFERQRQFTADASHELRTPVTVILSETQRMRKKPRSVEEYQEALDACHAAGLIMKKLVEDLLLLAREDSEENTLQLEDGQLDELISKSVQSLHVPARDKGIAVHVDMDPVRITTDFQKLLIVLNNILGNAISHHQGPGNVWITCKADGSVARISVRDDGPGIPSGDLPHIFRRFYRVDKSRSATDRHSGLGLAVCKSIVDQLKGTLDVSSELGQGSEFTIELPFGQSGALGEGSTIAGTRGPLIQS